MVKPDWFLLIDEWVRRGMGDYGTTLPFVVGALAMKTKKKSLGAQDVRDVVHEMTQHPVDDYAVEVHRCFEIGGVPVCKTTRLADRREMLVAVAVPRPSSDGPAMVFSPDLVEPWGTKDPQTCLDRLVSDAADPVSNGTYSRVRDESGRFHYGNYTTKELDYIKAVLGI